MIFSEGLNITNFTHFFLIFNKVLIGVYFVLRYLLFSLFKRRGQFWQLIIFQISPFVGGWPFLMARFHFTVFIFLWWPQTCDIFLVGKRCANFWILSGLLET